MKVRDIMTRDVFTLAPESTIREAMELLTAKHLSGAPVMAGEELVGVVSMADVLGFISGTPEPSNTEERLFVFEGIENIGDEIDQEQDADLVDATEDLWDEWIGGADRKEERLSGRSGILDNRTVEEIMSSGIITISPSASVKEAASMMRKHGIHRLIVTDRKSLVGIISALDIARAVSDRGLARKSAR
jgi:CBS domain-containing protein